MGTSHREMGIIAEVGKFVKGAKTLYFEASKEDYYFREMNKILQSLFLDPSTKQTFAKQLKDCKRLERFEALMEKQELPEYYKRKREALLKKYDAVSGLEMIGRMAIDFNNIYNSRNTPEAQWINLRVQFFDYQMKNREELEKLEEFKNLATTVEANHLFQRTRECYQELIDEEAQLAQKIEALKPINYRHREKSLEIELGQVTAEVEEKLSLFYEGGRTPLLRAYPKEILLKPNLSPEMIVQNTRPAPKEGVVEKEQGVSRQR